MKDKFIELAPAKINLFLKILNKRTDNYHNIRTGITFINLFDEIKVIEDSKFSIEITGPFKSYLNNKENIIKKTVFGLSNLIGIKPNFKIFFIKFFWGHMQCKNLKLLTNL